MANKFREIPVEETPVAEEVVQETVSPPEKPSKPRKKGVLAKSLSSVFSGTFLADERNVRFIPFILFLAGLSLFYIGYNYYADDNIRLENKLNKKIKEYHTEYISTTSELMFATKQSEMAAAVATLGLKEPIVPPVKIAVDSAVLYKNVVAKK